MYEMNDKKRQKKNAFSARDSAYIAIFVALVIAAQLCLAVLPGIELVTVLFVSFAFVFGVGKGMLAATAFSLLRQLVFGFHPVVLILYLIYYNLLALNFGLLGKRRKPTPKSLLFITALACIGTVCFTLFDNILTPLWYAYTPKAARLYFYASLPFMIPQVICTAVTVGVLFLPLARIFSWFKKR